MREPDKLHPVTPPREPIAAPSRLASMRSSPAALALALLAMLGACSLRPGGGAGSPSIQSASNSPKASITGRVTAGPTCPVVTDPPQSGCAERPVEGAVLVVQDRAGTEVARVTSAVDGSFVLTLPAGHYRLVPQPVEGLMRTAPEQPFEVGGPAAGAVRKTLSVSYDTGIR